MELLLIILIIATAGIILLRHLLNSLKNNQDGCCCPGCPEQKSCEDRGNDSADELRQEENSECCSNKP